MTSQSAPDAPELMNLPTGIRPAVAVEHVSVRYRLSRGSGGSLRSYVLGHKESVGFREHEALHDVSLALAPGSSLAAIGSNGSGKSTLMRLIARVIRPTTGRVRVHGRVAPLLDLVGGFHPDLSGRDNIILNGTLLGLRRREIEQRVESIVDFAEIGRFIDAPLRTYSAGMVLRVGFAVATDIEPDVLVIDEALGVGDEHFQRKCAARIDHLRSHGVTFILVSHDLQAVRRLCSRVIWLDRGHLRADGPAEDVISAYLTDQAT
jgi:ABC-type polysaccharide/polyol phosphate transport system ATPase subunit